MKLELSTWEGIDGNKYAIRRILFFEVYMAL
jgi:hypothetical protein